MTIHRMRTIGESVEIIKEIDHDSAITANCIRSLYKDGKVHCVFTGNKILVDLDDLIKYFLTLEHFSGFLCCCQGLAIRK